MTILVRSHWNLGFMKAGAQRSLGPALFCDETGFNLFGLSLTTRNCGESHARCVILWFPAHMLRGKSNKRFVDSGNRPTQPYAPVLIVVCVTWRPISCGAAELRSRGFQNAANRPSRYVSLILAREWKLRQKSPFGQSDVASFGASDILNDLFYPKWARGSVALCYEPEGRELETRWGDILILPNPSGALVSGFYSTSNRNEYQKQTNNVSGEQNLAGV
jgi:hypothetical protein